MPLTAPSLRKEHLQPATITKYRTSDGSCLTIHDLFEVPVGLDNDVMLAYAYGVVARRDGLIS